jgi:hypothetical protein
MEFLRALNTPSQSQMAVDQQMKKNSIKKGVLLTLKSEFVFPFAFASEHRLVSFYFRGVDAPKEILNKFSDEKESTTQATLSAFFSQNTLFTKTVVVLFLFLPPFL